MNSIQRLSRRYDALGTAQSHSPTPTEHLQRHPPSSYSTPFQALWHWVYAQWLVALFIRRVASGAELLVDVDDSGVEKGRRRGNDAVAGLEAPLIEEDDEYEGEEESPLRDKAERVKRERARLAAVAAAGDVSSSGPSLPDGQPSTSSSTRQSPPVPESPSPSTRPAFSLSTFSLEETIPIDSATPSRSSSSSTWPSPTLQFTPPTPHQPPTPLPPPQTLLLNPYATSFLTTHTRSSRRRGREPENQTSDSPPLGASSSGSSIINTTPPASRALTPTSTPPIPRSRRPVHRPKTLVLDLDETLIHSTSKAPANYYASYGQGLFSAGGLGFGIGSSGGFGFGGNTWGSRRGGPGHMVEVVLNGRSTLYHVYKRPFVDYFLKKVSTWYTLVIFTASMQEYADPVIDWLDAGRGIFVKRFFRELPNGSYSKDLTVVESDLASIALLDNSPVSYSAFPANGIPVEGWTSDPHDEALLDLLPFLDSLRFTNDVRRVLGIRGF